MTAAGAEPGRPDGARGPALPGAEGARQEWESTGRAGRRPEGLRAAGAEPRQSDTASGPVSSRGVGAGDEWPSTGGPGRRRTGPRATTAFDAALRGAPARMVRSDGAEVVLAVRRWHADAADDDGWLLDRCTGPVVDLGCGPGRLVVALTRRGIPALGVDVSAAAVARCRERGAAVLRRDLFAPIPGRWDHVLLADGNIGIGGDPARLLRRAAALLRPGGTVLVETDPDPSACWSGTARIHTANGAGPPLPWAVVGAAALGTLTQKTPLKVTATKEGRRSFTELGSVAP